MKKLNDQEIQEMLEKGISNPESNDQDFQTYDMVFEALKKAPAEGLPLNFSAKVIAQLQAKKDQAIDFKWYLIIPLVLIIAIGAFYLSLAYVNTRYAALFASLLSKYKWMITFTLSFFLTIEYLDKKVVRR